MFFSPVWVNLAFNWVKWSHAAHTRPCNLLKNNTDFLFVFPLSPPSFLSVSLSHTPTHKRHLHPWPRCEKLVHPRLNSPRSASATNAGKVPPTYIYMRVSECVFEWGCGNTWGVMNRRDLTLNLHWPVHTNRAFNPQLLLLAMAALVYSRSPPKEPKFIIYHFAYYFPPTSICLSWFLLSSLFSSCCSHRSSPFFFFALFTLSLQLTSTPDLEFSLEFWADWALEVIFIHFQSFYLKWVLEWFDFFWSAYLIQWNLTLCLCACVYARSVSVDFWKCLNKTDLTLFL